MSSHQGPSQEGLEPRWGHVLERSETIVGRVPSSRAGAPRERGLGHALEARVGRGIGDSCRERFGSRVAEFGEHCGEG